MLKNLASRYAPGERPLSSGWVKLKRDYLEGGTADTMDMAVVGVREKDSTF